MASPAMAEEPRRNGDKRSLETLVLLLGMLVQLLIASYAYGQLNERVSNLQDEVRDLRAIVEQVRYGGK